MARPARAARRRRTAALSHLTSAQEFELGLGPARGGRLSAFRDDAERRAAWELHRDRLRDEGNPPTWADEEYTADA